MADNGKDEELIGKLIKKRNEENDAFLKLLSAIEKGGTAIQPAKSKPKENDKSGSHEK